MQEGLRALTPTSPGASKKRFSLHPFTKAAGRAVSRAPAGYRMRKILQIPSPLGCFRGGENGCSGGCDGLP